MVCRFARVAPALLAALTFAACGGGGGGEDDDGVPPPPPPPAVKPTVSISADRFRIEEGQSTQLRWSSTHADSCTASGGWSGPLGTSGTRDSGPLMSTTLFAVSCSGAGGTRNASTMVRVSPPTPSATLEANPRFVREGQTSELVWSSVGVTTCEASGSWSGPRPLSGSETVGPFLQAPLLPYRLDCEPGQVISYVWVGFRPGLNLPPVADAGPDLSVGSTHRVELHSFSHDDHAIVSSAWAQTGGPIVKLGPGDSTRGASFNAPTVTTDTILTFQLTVTDDEGVTSAPDTVNVTVKPIPPTVTISGDVRYELVSNAPLGQGLSYVDQNFVPIADVFVQVLDAATRAVIASGTFTWDFQFTVPSQTELVLRATARMSRQAPSELPHWQISVRDLDINGKPLSSVYSYTGPAFNSGAGGRHSLQIPSGWNTAGQLIGPRHAAPFAILDSIRLALHRRMFDFPQPDLPPLTIDWAPSNPGGQTFYTDDGIGRHRIVLAGERDVDTDEYDQAVVLHEFGHYVMAAVSRDESVGGPHGFGDRLDMRVAFSEGFATAFGGFSAGQTVYVDSFGPGQANSGWFSLDADTTVNEGWYNEFSVHELLWDFDDTTAIWQALHAPLQQTDAFTSVFAFFTSLKQLSPGRAAYINGLLANERIVGPTINDYGSTETNAADSANVLPVYTTIALGGSAHVRSTAAFGTGNKLSNHRYLKFSLPATMNVRFDVTAAAGRDPELQIFRRGVQLAPRQGPGNESFSLALAAGEYVLDVYDCGNVGCNQNVTPGPTDITVSITPN
jgi:hypothetical protein